MNKKWVFLFLIILVTHFFVLNINQVQAQSDEIVDVRLSFRILDVDPKTKTAIVNIHVFVTNFPSNITALHVQILGGGSAYVPCKNTGLNGENTWFYQGESNRTDWVLSGDGECYPFDSYEITFRIDELAIVENNFTLVSDPNAIFDGANFRTLRSKWETETDLIPIKEMTSKKVVFSFKKTLNSLTNDIIYSLVPIIACYYLLGSTLILNPKDDLSGRLRIYLSLFVFSSTFLFTIQSSLPFHSPLTFPAMLLSNLTVSTAIFTIFSLIGNKMQYSTDLREKMGFYSKSDSFGLIIALLVFLIFYFITLFGKLNILTAIVFTYVVIPSYPFAIIINSPTYKITKHKLKWTLFLIFALLPIELILFFWLIS